MHHPSWLKAINHTDYKKDPGSDWSGYPSWRWFADGDTAAGDPGERPNGGSPFLKDGYAEVLHYYEGDFRHNGSPFDDDENNLKGGDLFNGNISAWQEVVAGPYSPTGNPFEGEIVGHTYRYDQMNRLTLTYFNTYDEPSDTWSYDGSYDEYLPHDGNGNITGGTRKGVDAGSVVDMDEATFYRHNTSNKLLYITDPHPQYGVASTPPSLTYIYDATGNLIEDPNNNLLMAWDHHNRPTSTTNANGETFTFLYDGQGNRVMKTKSGTGPKEMTFYIRDKYGNTLARYEENGAAVAVEERYVFGRNEVLGVMTGPNTMNPGVDTLFPFMHYYLYDHLGNVRATVEDTLRPHWPIGDPDPRISSYANYYAYGAPHLNRNYNQADFHHGFNGQERDDDVMGVGNLNTAKYRMYDPWVAMRWNLDPVFIPSLSPYAVFNTNPILYNDPLGNYSRVGAWWRNVRDGGGGIYKRGGEWGYNTSSGSAKNPIVKFNDGSLDKAKAAWKNYEFTKEIYGLSTGGRDLDIDVQVGVVSDAPMNTKDRINAAFNMASPALFNSAPSSVTVAPGRVFWSGGRQVAGNEAMNFAKTNGKITLEMTTSGKVLETVGKVVPYKYTSPLWNALSRRFAQGASGTVDFFTTPLGSKPNSIWLNVEKPILENNGVNIIMHTTP